MNKEQLAKIKNKYNKIKSHETDEVDTPTPLDHVIQHEEIHTMEDYVANEIEHIPIRKEDDVARQVCALRQDIRIIKNIMIFFAVLAGLSLLGSLIWGISFASNLAKMASMF